MCFLASRAASTAAESRQQMLEKEQTLETNVAALAERIEDDQVLRAKMLACGAAAKQWLLSAALAADI